MTSADEKMAETKAKAAEEQDNAVYEGLSPEGAGVLRRLLELSPGHRKEHKPGEDCDCPLPVDCPDTAARVWLGETCRQMAAVMLRVKADRINNAKRYEFYTPEPGFRLEILAEAILLMAQGHTGGRLYWEALIKALAIKPNRKDEISVVDTALIELKGVEAPARLRFPHGKKHPRREATPGTACDGDRCGGMGDADTEMMLACFDSTFTSHVATDDIYAVDRRGRQRGRATMVVDGKATSTFGSSMVTIAYSKLGSHPGPHRVANVASLLRGQALAKVRDATPTALPVRAAVHGRGYLIDLGQGQYVEVAEDGWRVTPWKRNYPVMLAAARPLPVPVQPGQGQPDPRLRHLGFATGDPNWHQIRMWQATAFFCDHERQLMFLTGGSGSGKSKRAQSVAAIVDPLAEDAHGRPVMGGPLPDDDTLAPELLRNYLFTSDNLTHLDEEDSDRLCRIATGYRFVRRVLYTTADTYSVVVLRAGLLTGIDVPPQLREDAQNRLLHLELDPTAEKRSSSELDEERRTLGPQMLGALLNDMVAVLKAFRAGQYDEHDRFPIVACAAQVFGEEYVKTRDGRQSELAITRAEGDTMLAAVAQVVRWAGMTDREDQKKRTLGVTAQELFDAVVATQENHRIPKGWSTNPNALKTRMGRNLATLRAFGIEMTNQRTEKERWTELVYHEDRARVTCPGPRPQDEYDIAQKKLPTPFWGAGADARSLQLWSATRKRVEVEKDHGGEGAAQSAPGWWSRAAGQNDEGVSSEGPEPF
jgi:hypothetical protein